ncbi:MAG: NAD(P)H-quinone oxidoreductase, partial [Pseudomonadota bacterium]
MPLPDTMTTIEIREHGGPDVLELGERPLPTPAAGEVLVKIIAAGVNGPDIIQRRGHYPPPPGASDLLGLEVSGEVVALGDSVDRWKVGDTICALTNGGGYAQYVTIPADQCLPIPEGIDPIDAAGLCETLFTVWSNFFTNHAADKGLLFLVHGGAGGIGSAAIQLGAAVGMRVFTTCSAEDKAYCEGLGAERAIDYRDEDFVEVVKAAGGANLILDIRGGDYVERNIKAAAPDARTVQLAFNAGSRVEVNLMPVMLKRLIITG